MADEFDLTAARLVWLPVTFDMMVSAGSALAEPVKHTIELQVELVDLDEFGRLFISPRDENGEPRSNAIPEATPERLAEWDRINDTTRALAITRDWRRVVSGGVATPYSEEAMRRLMRVSGFAEALFLRAYPSAFAGMKETRSGNFDGSPADGAASDADAQ